ncbi:MAG: hypothetical protein ACI8W8_001844 [Rhodothermales bacterium]|jgi:hypothetical protein
MSLFSRFFKPNASEDPMPDPVADTSPEQLAFELELTAYVREALEAPTAGFATIRPQSLDTGKALLAMEPHQQLLLVASSVRLRRLWQIESPAEFAARMPVVCSALDALLLPLTERHLPFADDDLRIVANDLCGIRGQASIIVMGHFLGAVERFQRRHALSKPLQHALSNLREASPIAVATRIEGILSGGEDTETDIEARPLGIRPKPRPMDGKTVDVMQADLVQVTKRAPMPSRETPDDKWLRESRALVDSVGPDHVRKMIKPAFAAALRNPQQPIDANQARILKGYVWLGGLLHDDDLTRETAELAASCLREMEGGSPRSAKLGRVCLAILSAMATPSAVAQLNRLRQQFQHTPAERQVERALDDASRTLGVDPDDFEELAVPTFGLDSQGVRRDQYGEYTAELRVNDRGNVQLSWRGPEGRIKEQVPSDVRLNMPSVWEGLKTSIKDLESVLAAQRARLERLLRTERCWDYSYWRDCYANHPVIGILTRRLIWDFEFDGHWLSGFLIGDRLLGLDGEALPELEATSLVRIWHPVHAEEESLQWREWVENLKLTQPFPQAHRPCYALDDRERKNQTYSTRFAARVLDQAKLKRQASRLGWRFDPVAAKASGELTLVIPMRQMRACFSIEGVDAPPTADGYASLIETQELTFTDLGGRPQALASVEPAVFSEVAFDVGRLVEYCCIAHDPTCLTHGEVRGFPNYWMSTAQAPLSAAARMRRELLERLLPRMPIADVCEIDGDILRIRGSFQTYSLHLGSANVTVGARNVCIHRNPGEPDTYVPFEDDHMLARLLSLAFLLARDSRITDSRLLEQIRRAQDLHGA